MAYGTKYFAPYKSGNVVRTINLMLDGYSGSATEWYCSVTAPVDEQGYSDKLFGETIVPKIVRLEFLFDQNYDLTEFVAEPRTYKVVIQEGSETIFEGFCEPYDTYHNYQKPGYFVSMTATCGLNRLSKNIYQQTEFNEGNLKLNYFELIQRCLQTIGIERNIRVSLHTQQNAYPSSPNPLLSCEVNVFRYFADGSWMDCQTIINDILQKFNAQLFLDGNVWVIRSIVDHALGFTDSYVYDPSGSGSPVGAWDLDRNVNYESGQPIGDQVTLKGGQISLTPRIRKYTTNVDFGGKDEQFINGGLQLWDVNGPVGWEGNMMPALGGNGWTKVETGIEGNPFALHIRGIAPKPYFKTHKKGIWPFRKTVKTPIEPAIYWETPEIEIKKTDESITLGFEYFTEANSAGFLYTVTLFATDPPNEKVVSRVYVKPGESNFPFHDEYLLLTAPPHPKVDPETGLTQSKGRIEYNIPLTQLNSGPVFFDRAEIWFYFSVQEDGKSGDEYTIYKIIGERTVSAEDDAPDGDSRYKVVVESNPYESDEGETINLITGDYAAGYLGTTTINEGDLTKKWSRRGKSEAISIYRAMLADRLAVTYEVADVVQADIYVRDGEEIRYLNLLRFVDRNPSSVYAIVRYSYNHYTRIATVTAVEVNYVELATIKQRSYTEARGLLDEDPEGDAVYPGAGTPSGRIGAEDPFEELDPEEEAKNARTGLFEDVPALTYVFGEESTESVNLADFFSELYLAEQDEEIEEEDRHNPYDFHFETKYKPTWISELSVVFLNLAATGKPTQIGSTSIVFEVTDDAFGVMKDVTVPVIVYPKTKLGYTLLEVGSGNPVEVGPLPGAYLPPAKADISISISGTHDYYQFTLEGGGANGNAFKQTVSSNVPLTTSDVYRMFSEDNGVVLAEGVYRLFVYTAIDERAVCRQDITFVLGDEEFLSKVKFFLTDGGSDIGEIEPSGESIFPDPGAWDNRVVITDVEHDKAIVKLSKPDGTGIHERTITHTSPVTTGSYFVYEDDQSHPIGRYNVSVTLFLEGEQVMMRYADFTTIKKAPEAVGGLIQLLTKSASGVNFSVAATLPKTGVSAQTLPPTGWNLGSDAVTDEFDWEGDELFELKGGSLFKVDIATFIGRPSFVEYDFPITYSDYRAFDNFSSLNIGKIHGNNKTFRYIRSRKLGGQSGDVVAVMQADFSFGTLKPIDDETEVEEPGSGYADFVAGAGMEEVIEDSIKRFNVRVDDESLEIFEEESPNDPDSPGLNHLRIKEKGVLYKHIQNMPADTVLGRRDTAGTPGPIQIKKLLAHVVDGDLVTIDVIKEVLEDSIDGTPNFIPKFGTDGHSLVDSIIREVSGKIGIGIGNPFEMLDVQGNIRATGTLISGIADGTPPIAVISSTLVHNLNVEYLDSHPGPYYLDWDNFTNYKSIIVGTGMTGGGLLDQNVNIGLNFTYLDGRYTTSASSAVSWASVNSGGLSKYNTSGAAAPFGGGGTVFHGVFLGHGSNAAYGTSLAFRNGRGFFQSIEAGTWGSWFEIATQAWVTAGFVPLTRTISTGTGLLGGGALSSNLSLTLDYSYLDDRYQPMVGSALPWNSVNTPGTPKFNVSATDGPLGVASVHGLFINHGTNTSFGTSIAFRDGRGFWKSVNGGTWASTWFEFASVKYVEDTYVPLVRTISTGTGLLGGSSLAANISLTLDYTYLDDRYQMNSGISIPWSSINAAAKPRFNVNATDGPMGGTAVHGLFINHNANSNFGTTIAGRNNRLFFQSVENGSWQSWLEIASQPWVNAKQVIAGNGLTGGSSLASDPVITLGTPSTIGNSTSNMVTSTSHTHAIQVSNLVAGSNVTLSASGTGVILGSNNITISVNAFPWPNISSKPTTLSGFGIVDAPTFDYLGIQLGGKENVFSKGSLIQGGGIVLSGTLINRLVGSGDVTISLGSVPWSSLTGVPNTLGGYGLSSTVYTKSEVNALIAGVGGINGSGSNTYHAMWGAGNTLTQSSVMQEVGGQVTINGHLVVQGGAFRPPESTGGLPASGAIEGELRYSTTGKSMNFWNGTAWKKITDS